MNSATRPILVVEDDEVDVMTIRRALAEIRVANTVLAAENGEEALRLLRDGRTEAPCIILLDLNMPVMNGTDFLRAVQHDARLRRIPVVMLTTSNEPGDRASSAGLGVDGYLTKPVDYRRFVEMMRSIDRYWTAGGTP
jgi:CheY-like chemotaxis protein